MNATYDNYLLTDPIGSTEAAHNISDLRNRIVVTFVLELLSYRLARSLLPDHNRPSTFAKPPYVSFTYEKKEGIRFYARVFSKILALKISLRLLQHKTVSSSQPPE